MDYIDLTVYIINGNNYVKLREGSDYLDFLQFNFWYYQFILSLKIDIEVNV